MKHQVLASLFPAVLLILLVAGCSSAEPTPTATPSPTPEPPPEFVPGECGFDVPSRVDETCGTVAVPQDRTEQGGPTFNLAVAVFASDAAAPAADAIVYLAGGPGENALDTLTFTFDDLFRPMLAERDVVVFDQRGAGLSEPHADCQELVALEVDLLGGALSIDEEGERWIDAASACFDRLTGVGVSLDALSTAESAADVHAIMTALGYDEWNLLGISYGTRLAQTIMRDRPDGVRSVILDSVVPLEADLIAQTPGSFDRALQALIDACAASEPCAEDHPGLGASLEAAVQQLNATPASGIVTNQLTLESYASVATGADLASQVFQGLYSSQVIPLLPEMIGLAAEGEPGLLDLLRGVSLTNSAFISTGMQMALQCKEEASFTNAERVAAASEPFVRVRAMLEGSRAIGSELFDLCERSSLTAAPAIENEPVTSDIPTLVLAGGFDPITPPSGGRQVAGRLTNATFVEIPAAGHAALTSGDCARELAAAFLADPHATVDGSCASEQEAPTWVRPVAATMMEPYRNALFGISGVKPKGWTELAPGAFGRSELGVVSLLEQVVPGTSGEELVGILQASLPGSPEFLSFGAFRSGQFTWDLVQANAGGQLIILAVAQSENATPFVMVTGLPSQEEALLNAVLGPVLQAFTLAP